MEKKVKFTIGRETFDGIWNTIDNTLDLIAYDGTPVFEFLYDPSKNEVYEYNPGTKEYDILGKVTEIE